MKRYVILIIGFFLAATPAAGALEPAAEPAASIEERLKRPWGRNPFEQVEVQTFDLEAAEGSAKLELTGILVRGGKSVAIINRSFFREGDDINGFKVERIENHRVTLASPTERLELALKIPTILTDTETKEPS